MEGVIREGGVAGVLDITTTKLADELVGGLRSFNGRCTDELPQVISVGALDMVNFGAKETVPEKFKDRILHQHDATVTLMRTSMDECQALGVKIGRKASVSTAPVSVLFPSLG